MTATAPEFAREKLTTAFHIVRISARCDRRMLSKLCLKSTSSMRWDAALFVTWYYQYYRRRDNPLILNLEFTQHSTVVSSWNSDMKSNGEFLLELNSGAVAIIGTVIFWRIVQISAISD